MEWYPLTSQNQDYYKVKDDCRGEMISFSGEENVFDLCRKLWRGAPFIAEVVLNEEQETGIIQTGRDFIRRTVYYGTTPSVEEQDVITAALILTAQDFDENEDETQMWHYLGMQLGFEDETVFMAACSKLRRIIRTTAKRNNRYFAEDGHVYYNTLFIHALAPSWTIYHLYNIIYAFYINNLELQYIEKDSSYSIFVNNIAARWENENVPNTDLKLKSDAISSSFRQLFSYRKNLMTAVCDRLVFKIDELLKGNPEALDMQNRWDVLLKDWYESKTAEEQGKMKEAKRRAGKARIATKKANIHPVYIMENGRIAISFPRIRLPEITRDTQAELYQCDELIKRIQLQVRGDELCWTTSEFFFDLSEGEINDSMPFNFRVKIFCKGHVMIFDSEESLYREFITFRKKGSEIRKVSSDIQEFILFADSQAMIEIDDDPDNYYAVGHCGFLYHLNAGTAKHVFVNGCDILREGAPKAKIRCIFSEKYLENIRVIRNEETHYIFTKPISLQILCEDTDIQSRYYVVVNGEHRSLANYKNHDGLIKVALPWKSKRPYDVRVIEAKNSKTVFEACYYVFYDFQFWFDKPYYLNVEAEGRVHFRIGGVTFSNHFRTDPSSNVLSVTLWDEYPVLINIPKLEISLGDKNAFNLPERIWHKDIPVSAFVHVKKPNGVKVSIALGGKYVPSNESGTAFELGSFLHNGAIHSVDELPLWASIQHGDQSDHLSLTDIEIKARFLEPPLCAEDKKLFWNPEGKYIGGSDDDLKLSLTSAEFRRTYDLTTSSKILETEFPGEDGNYKYEISAGGGLFQKKKIIFSGEIIIGNPARVRLKGKIIHLKRVKYYDLAEQEDKKKSLPEKGAIISEIEYIGRSIPKDTDLPEKEEYIGILLRYSSDGKTQKYTYKRISEDCEAINPVHIWLVDSKRLIMKTASGTDVWLNTETSKISSAVRIINTLQDYPSGGNFYISIPEYFVYEIEEGEPINA